MSRTLVSITEQRVASSNLTPWSLTLKMVTPWTQELSTPIMLMPIFTWSLPVTPEDSTNIRKFSIPHSFNWLLPL